MKKHIVSLIKTAGESAAKVPIEVRSWPVFFNQPEIPEKLRAKMEEKDEG
jgi:hypothetical protein